MPDYRAYIVGPEGRYISFEVIVAHDDATAIRIATKLVDGHDVELWHGDRKIGILHPNHVLNPLANNGR